MGHALGRRSLRWTVPLALAAAVGAVLMTTLASPNKASADVVIAGARSISDPVSITYVVKKKGTTTDVHLLAFNDLHGNLEAGRQQHLRPVRRWRCLPGQGDQGPPGAVRRPGGDRLRRRQHRRQPARERAVLRGADHDRHQPDERRLRLGRQPRVRQGQRPSCCGSRTAAASPVDGCTAAPYALADGGTTNVYPGRRLPVPVGQRRRRRNGQDALPGVRRPRQFKTATAARSSRSGSSARCSKDTPTIVTPTGVAGLTFEDEADAANAVVQQLKKRRTSTTCGARDPPGRLPVRHAPP